MWCCRLSLLVASVAGCNGDSAERALTPSPPPPPVPTIKVEVASPPSAPVPAEEQLVAAVSGKILKRTRCGAAHLLVIDPGLESARTELTVATFDPDFVLGDRRQGRWSVHSIERLPEQSAADWSSCIATADRPTVFVATTRTTYSVLIHATDHAVVIRQGTRAAGAPVELTPSEQRGGEQGVMLKVGSQKTFLAWDDLHAP